MQREGEERIEQSALIIPLLMSTIAAHIFLMIESAASSSENFVRAERAIAIDEVVACCHRGSLFVWILKPYLRVIGIASAFRASIMTS